MRSYTDAAADVYSSWDFEAWQRVGNLPTLGYVGRLGVAVFDIGIASHSYFAVCICTTLLDASLDALPGALLDVVTL